MVDSLAAASTKVEMDADFDKDGWATTKAIVISKAMRKITQMIARQQIALVFTNQLRQKLGVMFVATINKNLKSYLTAIIGAEYILKWLPIGTHDWNKFLTPTELEKIASKQNFVIDEVKGVKFNFFLKRTARSAN